MSVELSDLLAMMSPLYASAVYNIIQLTKIKQIHKACLFCQKSKKIFEKEIDMMLNEVQI